MRVCSFEFTNTLGTVYGPNPGNIVFGGEDVLFSPVGNRVRSFDILTEQSYSFPAEARSDISVVVVSPDNKFLFTIDNQGYGMLVNIPRRVVLHRMNFTKQVGAAAFSPNGRYLAVGIGHLTEIWELPLLRSPEEDEGANEGDPTANNSYVTDSTPFRLHHTHQGHTADVCSLSWSPCGNYFLSGAQDGSVRLFSLMADTDYAPTVFASNRSAIRGAWFGQGMEHVFTVALDGGVFVWRRGIYVGTGSLRRTGEDFPHVSVLEGSTSIRDLDIGTDHEILAAPEHEGGLGHTVGKGSYAYHLVGKYFPEQTHKAGSRITISSASFAGERMGVSTSPELLLLGFSNGVFSLYTMGDAPGVPRFSLVHSLSVSADKVTTTAISPSGAKVALGCAGRGQLMVWDWHTEAYLLKQQGHAGATTAMAYSPDGLWLATGGDDGKVKLWSSLTGLCAVTFTDHVGPVRSLCFLPPTATGVGALVSASTDGTLRAYDLARYRCFRTMTHPQGAQFTSVAVDPLGSVVAAGTDAASDGTYDIAIFSLRTGQLMDLLSGHRAPVVALAFSQLNSQLASASLDGCCRVWDVFAHGGATTNECLVGSGLTALAYRPDGREYCVATINGSLCYIDADTNELTYSQSISLDISPGRLSTDTRTSATTSVGRCFTCLAYSPDSTVLLAGGESRNLCVYSTTGSRPLVRRIQLSHSRDLDGVLTKFNSSKLLQGGIREQDLRLARSDIDSEMEAVREERQTLPGAKLSLSDRRVKRAIRATSLAFSCAGDQFAVGTADCVLVFGAKTFRFDPLALEPSLTPARVHELVAEKKVAPALAMALRLGDESSISYTVYNSSLDSSLSACRQLDMPEASRFADWLANEAISSPHFVLLAEWAVSLFRAKGLEIRRNKALRSGISALRRSFTMRWRDLGAVIDQTGYLCRVLSSIATKPTPDELEGEDNARRAQIEAREAEAGSVRPTLAEYQKTDFMDNRISSINCELLTLETLLACYSQDDTLSEFSLPPELTSVQEKRAAAAECLELLVSSLEDEITSIQAEIGGSTLYSEELASLNRRFYQVRGEIEVIGKSIRDARRKDQIAAAYRNRSMENSDLPPINDDGLQEQRRDWGKQIEDLTSFGSDILSSVQDQGKRLREAEERVLLQLGGMGVSDRLIAMMRRTGALDYILVILLFIIVSVIVILFSLLIRKLRRK